jgi:hypothetical protein
MLKKAVLFSAAVACHSFSSAQTAFLPLGTENYHALDRWETMSGRLCDSLRLQAKPESRRNAIHFIESINDTAHPIACRLSDIDRYNMEQMVSESGEWAGDENGAIDSKHPWFNAFYKKQYNFIYVKTDNFFMVVNPVINFTGFYQNNNPSRDSNSLKGATIPSTGLFNSRGVEVRGWIAKKIGFYTSFTDNQEEYPYHVLNNVSKRYEAVPGQNYFKRPTTRFGAYDYLDATGYINFDAVKNHVNITMGFGKNFYGDGLTSLLLTDNSSAMPFVRLQGRIWKLNYECLYLELTPQYLKFKDQTIGHKYSTMRYLTWNATRWLNFGLFESQVFNRSHYEFAYMNPIILTTAMSRYTGAGDKSLLGITGKMIIAKHLQLYGQFILNEFKVKELFGGNKWYGNKWGIQTGAKYFNAFGLRNLDLQAELDAVRPYTYSAQDTIVNYTNYNQPLADPLGAGFVKATGVAYFQPVKNFYITAKATYYVRGTDTGLMNYGNNIFRRYTEVTPVNQFGVNMINGPKAHASILDLTLSYQLRRYVFADLSLVHRSYASNVGVYPHYSTTGPVYSALNTNYISFGIRINAPRRDYSFF